jgi:hypothetical protein
LAPSNSTSYSEALIKKSSTDKSSVADQGCCGSEFLNPGSRIEGQKDPGSASAYKNLSIYNPRTVYEISEK